MEMKQKSVIMIRLKIRHFRIGLISERERERENYWKIVQGSYFIEESKRVE